MCSARMDFFLNMLGVRLPIIQGGMLWLATAELAAAVSNSGALGTVSPYAAMPKDGDPLKNLEIQLARLRKTAKGPFAVNIMLDLPLSGVLLDAAVRGGAKVVITAAGDPGIYTPLLRCCGVTSLHVVTSAAQAKKAENAGVDAVVVQGIEAGGRHARGSQPLFSLLPRVLDAVNLPVVAAGGIVDGRGAAAALALGASAVQLGTRFIATAECPAHLSYKQRILAAGDGATVLTGGDAPCRCLDTVFTRRLRELEACGATPEELRAARLFRGSREAQLEGRADLGELYCGASAGLIQEVFPAAEVVARLAADLAAALQLPVTGLA